jgi:hypothetical protein
MDQGTGKVTTKHDQWVSDIRSADGAMEGISLTEWEEEFMESIEERLDDCESLTPKQAETLEAIWDRI